MDRVAVSVQASQDQQNNSVKHLETVYIYFVYFKLYVYVRGTLSGAGRLFEKWCARNICMESSKNSLELK